MSKKTFTSAIIYLGDKMTLLEILRAEKAKKISGGIYHKLQIEFTYNSNHIEGSKLSHDQTRYIFETNALGVDEVISLDDVIETANHFRCVDYVIDNAMDDLNQNFIKTLHKLLKAGTSQADEAWFAVGDYKHVPNEVGGRETTAPEDVEGEMKKLLEAYACISKKSFEDLVYFHYKFESIHPFQDGNGRVGRLILLKEALKENIVPFIIDEDLKYFYYRGLANYKEEKGYLMDTCLTAQDKFKKYLDYFRIKY